MDDLESASQACPHIQNPLPQKNLYHAPEAHSSSHAPVHVHLGADSWEVLKNLAQVNWFEC